MMQYPDHYGQIDAGILEVQVRSIYEPLIDRPVACQVALGGLQLTVARVDE